MRSESEMTRKDIVRLWDEANNWGIPIQSGLVEELERFAALVAAAEREACANECDEWIKNGSTVAEDIAYAIRARGEE